MDLSKVCHPGKEERRLEIRSYKVYAGEVMHEIDTMSHIGTHVEVPSHFIEPLRNHSRVSADFILAFLLVVNFLNDRQRDHHVVVFKGEECLRIVEQDVGVENIGLGHHSAPGLSFGWSTVSCQLALARG